jgi:hypothetical protein
MSFNSASSSTSSPFSLAAYSTTNSYPARHYPYPYPYHNQTRMGNSTSPELSEPEDSDNLDDDEPSDTDSYGPPSPGSSIFLRGPTKNGADLAPARTMRVASKSNLRLPPLVNLDPQPPNPLYSSRNPTPKAQMEKLPPIYTQFMREFSIAPTATPQLPPTDPPSVPKATVAELRRQNINPYWVVLPRFGETCPFADKPSCSRTDWRPAMWERHVQTHLPDTMKEFWECPHCFRPFNRKCAFVNHLRKTRTECGVKGTLDMVHESDWKGRWFHEPMPLRYDNTPVVRPIHDLVHHSFRNKTSRV